MSALTLSIGVPNFNHARFLPVALEALVTQNYRPLEIIVIDDGSTDASVDVISTFARRCPHLRLVRHVRNLGVGATLSELLEMARGDYFFAPAADDVILPGFLDLSMALLAKHPSAGLCSTESLVMRANGERVWSCPDRPIRGPKEGYFLPAARCAALIGRRGLWIHGNTAIFHRRAFLAAGGYRPELGHYQDGFMHQLLALKHGACFVPQKLAVERRMPDTYSARASQDPVEMRRVRDLAISYMLGEYSDMFSPRLVRQWRMRWDYWRTMAHTSRLVNEWRSGLRRLLMPGGPANCCLFGLSSALIAMGLFAVKAAAVLRIMPMDARRIFFREIAATSYHRIRRAVRKRLFRIPPDWA